MVRNGRTSNRLQALAIANPDTKKFNRKELEEACRKLNPNRTDIAGAKRQRAQDFDLDIQKGGNGVENQIKSLDVGVKICARKYNECKARADKLVEEVAMKRDEIIELQREGSVLEDMVNGNNNEAKKITTVNQDIEEANKISDERMHYRLKLNHMHQRQRKNRIVVDAHMSEMTSAVDSAKRERKRCFKMIGEIESGVTSALHDLDNATKEVSVERLKREQSLVNKKIEVANAEKLEQWRNAQELNRKDFEQALGGSYQLEKENRLYIINGREEELKQMSRDTEAKTSGQGSSEEAFMHIKRATGVNDLNEMVDKLTNFQEQRNRLQMEKQDAEERLESSKNSLFKKQDEFAALKANGLAGDVVDLTRDGIAEVKKTIEEELADSKILRSSYTRLEGVLVGLRQGCLGLYQRILPFHSTLLECDAPTMKDSASASVVDVANDTLEMMKTSQKIIGKMVDVIGGVDKITKPRDEKSQVQKETNEKLENPNLGTNNCRIQPKISSSPNSHKKESDDTNALYFDIEEVESDKLVLTRTMLKAQSESQAGEARRQEEMERRELKSKEKLSNDGTASTEAKKLQEESIQRMSKHSLPMGLPKTVSMRADPLTKAQAFISEVPIIE